MMGIYIRGAIALAVWLSAGMLTASTVVPMSLREVSTQAHRIAVGRIERITSSRDAATGHIVSRVELFEARSFSGAPLGSLAVEMVGGTFGGIRQWIAGFPSLDVGDRVVLFLAENPGTPLGPTVGLWQGVYFVEQDAAGAEIVADHLRRPLTEIRGEQAMAGERRLPRGAAAQTGGPLVTLDAFLTRVRGWREAAGGASDRR
jgi:hypothetical protein